ncbi:hypothetical protein [Rhizobium metallidurans]|uniref:Uncharacterized protein n=1 Tax=Rhizobium metallidurans TaxID=1265931 RepID=A0A7W6CSJ1_9HYPH|nr:hypothetical protein [Rhizobium metallidurans]MBB3965384.1 hypothetical protein [Rhizobium metallidurans]
MIIKKEAAGFQRRAHRDEEVRMEKSEVASDLRSVIPSRFIRRESIALAN